MDIRAILQEARDKEMMVAVQRACSDRIAGFVISVTDTFVLLQEWQSDLRLDGFHVVRVDSLDALEIPYSHQDFAKRVQSKRGDARAEIEVDLTDWNTVIDSTRNQFPIGRYELYSAESDFLTERACGRVITIDPLVLAAIRLMVLCIRSTIAFPSGLNAQRYTGSTSYLNKSSLTAADLNVRPLSIKSSFGGPLSRKICRSSGLIDSTDISRILLHKANRLGPQSISDR